MLLMLMLSHIFYLIYFLNQLTMYKGSKEPSAPLACYQWKREMIDSNDCLTMCGGIRKECQPILQAQYKKRCAKFNGKNSNS